MDNKAKEYLTSLDTLPYQKISDYEVAQGISGAIGNPEEKPKGEVLFDILAFEFYPRHEGGVSDWGTYFGSKMSFRKDENSNEVIEFPSLSQVSAVMVEYWSKRAKEVKHPILVERYADLAYDFSEYVAKPKDYALAQLVIDSALVICEEDIVEDIYQRQELHRALSLALTIKDKERIQKVAQAVIETERKIAEDDKAGLWGFAFMWLVIENSDKINLEPDTTKTLLKDLEARLTRLLSVDDPDPWGIEHAVNLLSQYYLRKNDQENTLRVLLSLEDAFRKNKRSNSDGLLKVNYLEKIDALFRQFGQVTGMRPHIDRVAKELPNASREALSSLKNASSEIAIKMSDIEQVMISIYGERSTLPEVAIALVGHFLVRKEKVKEQLDKHSKEFVFQFIVEHRRLAADGHTEAIIPPITEDYEAHLFNHAFMSMRLAEPFLIEALPRFKKKFSLTETYEYLKQSPLFPEEEKEYLLKGLQAYWSEDYLGASQNFIPYIESAIRKFVSLNGGITLRIKPDKEYGGYEYRGLGALLEEECINRVFGFNITFYFKLVLTHTLGWNLRNNLAHGINLNSFFRQDVSDRLFHILLLLAQVRGNGEK